VRPTIDGLKIYSHANDDWRACRDYVYGRLGLDPKQTTQRQKPKQPNVKRTSDRDLLAFEIWEQATDPRDTLAERYLNSRGIELTADVALGALRYHPRCAWEGGVVPALVAAFRSIKDNELTGIHRIRLDRAALWPKTERKMLGTVGGSAVKLDPKPVHRVLTIGEGIETCLAARSTYHPVWALGSVGAIAHFPKISNVNYLRVLAERGAASERALRQLRQRVSRVESVWSSIGSDFNDELMQIFDTEAAR
jgi:hypothetical protein